MKRVGLAVWVLAFAVSTGGCGDSSSSSSSDDDTAKEPTVTSSPSTPASGPAGVAVADLATRLDVEPASIEVVSEETVTWNDGSLGCAQPGNFYTQALVDGSRITLRADGTDYEYHSGGSKQPFWCEKPTQ